MSTSDIPVAEQYPEAHIMLDLETLGVTPGSVICSLAAVHFDLTSGYIHSTFYQRIDIQSCLDAGLTVTGDTIKFWMGQPDAARTEITAQSQPLRNVLLAFASWLRTTCRSPKSLRIWGNGENFDQPILEAAYNACKIAVPWPFWTCRDVRTIVDFAPDIKKSTPFQGVQHNPLDDAVHQVKYLSAIISKINKHLVLPSA